MIVSDYDGAFDYPMHVVGDPVRPVNPTYKEPCYHYYEDRDMTEFFEDYEKRYPEDVNLIRKDAGNQFMTILFYVKKLDSYFVCKLSYDNIWLELDNMMKDIIFNNVIRLNCTSWRHSDYKNAFMNYLTVVAP